MKKKLILVDGSSYLHRAFHALPSLTTSRGQPTGAIYGVVNMLRRLLKDYDTPYIAVVFDAKGKNFRHEMYEEYKANRDEMDTELVDQIEPLHETIEAMGFPIVMESGVEADDVIATLASLAKKEDFEVVIITSDKDLAQLVDDDVTLFDTMKNRKMDRAGVVEKFGVKAEQIVDYLALIGDTSDNVPGVPGVGPKTAAKWLKEYETLDSIIESCDKIKGKVGERLCENLDTVKMARELVIVKKDLALKETIEDLKRKKMAREKLIEIFTRLEFSSWLKKLLADKQGEINTNAIDNKKNSDKKYHTVLTEEDFNSLLHVLKNASEFAFDTETTSLDPFSAELVGLSFSLKANEAFYIPVAHDYEGAPAQLSREKVLSDLKPILENEKIKKIGQNLKYDVNVISNYGIHVQGLTFDTMLESYILNSTGKHDLDTLALKYLGVKATSFEEVAGKGAKQLTFNQVEVDVASDYSAEDADFTLCVHNELWPKLKEDEALKNVFEKIEMPLLSVLCLMEQNGVLLDEELLNKQSETLAKRILELESEAYKEAGQEFNLGSPKQLREILFDKLNLPVLAKTPTKQPSTAENVLKDLAAKNFSLPTILLEYRTLSKLKSTYTDALPQKINRKTGRVHTSYNQAVTSTGRLSSTEPNLQNIPSRTDAGRLIRKAFIAPSGFDVVAADYSQIELRIMAHLSKDPGLCGAFSRNEDVHKTTAAEIFGVKLDEVTGEQRRRAKAINFGLIYGMSGFGLSRQLGIERKEAEEYIEIYFSRYPKVKEYMENARELAHEKGFVETMFGRRLYVPEINAQNFMRRAAAERAAINAPLQGTAADIMKLAMINMDALIRKENLHDKVKMLMQVHDEIVFEVAKDSVESVNEKIKDVMENAAKLEVPLLVAIGVGDNWDEAH